MGAVFRREFSTYFKSPIGYIFLAAFFVVAGAFLYIGPLIYASAELSYVFSPLLTIIMILIPLITMRLFSEEKKLKTDQLLLTSPVSLTGLVMGKFLAAMLIYTIAVSITLVYALVLAVFADPGWAMVFGNYFGLLCIGGSLIAIGLFISALTESQIVAAIGTYACVVVVLLIDAFASLIPITFLSNFVASFSFFSRYEEFTYGLFNFESILFFISIFVVFIFLTIRVLDKKRWN